jgi:hypothetical protein
VADSSFSAVIHFAMLVCWVVEMEGGGFMVEASTMWWWWKGLVKGWQIRWRDRGRLVLGLASIRR